MSVIRPLPGIRYNTKDGTDLSKRLAPPYDVLSDADKQQLLGQDSHNFVKIDLPHTPPKDAGPPEVYAAARQTLEEWLQSGVLVKDDAAGIYAYYQNYEYAGQQYTRKMFFARLRVEPFGSGSVFPHEQTFGGPKEDRLALTKACEANLSPIFGLFPDPQNEVAAVIENALPDQPVATGTLDGIESRMWRITDDATIADVQARMDQRATFIADGHHRYGTALLYQKWADEQHGPLAEEDPANFVLCVFCAMEDPGLLILPTHRVLPGVSVTPETFDGHADVAIEPQPGKGVAEVLDYLATLGPQAVAFYNASTGAYYTVKPQKTAILDALAPDKSAAWRELGLAFLHAYIIDHVVTPRLCAGQAPEIRYIKSDDQAVATANETQGTAFLMQPTTMDEMRAVCSTGELMPQKSTFFYPKLASGLLINPLA